MPDRAADDRSRIQWLKAKQATSKSPGNRNSRRRQRRGIRTVRPPSGARAFFILSNRVEREIPRVLAASRFSRRRVRARVRMCRRSAAARASQRVGNRFSGPTGSTTCSGKRASGPIQDDCPIATARSMRFLSSRTLPGHRWVTGQILGGRGKAVNFATEGLGELAGERVSQRQDVVWSCGAAADTAIGMTLMR